MTARHLDYFFKYLFRVERACGIVRVDNYDALGFVGDFFLMSSMSGFHSFCSSQI